MNRRSVLAAALLALPSFARAQNSAVTVTSQFSMRRYAPPFGSGGEIAFDSAPCPAEQTTQGNGSIVLNSSITCSVSGTRAGTFQAWNPETWAFGPVTTPDYDSGTLSASTSASLATTSIGASVSAAMGGTANGLGVTSIGSSARLSIMAHIDDLTGVSGLSIFFPKTSEMSSIEPSSGPGVSIAATSGILFAVNAIDPFDGHVTETPIRIARNGLSTNGMEFWGPSYHYGSLWGDWPDDPVWIDQTYFNSNGDVNLVIEVFVALVAQNNGSEDPISFDLAGTASFGAPSYSVDYISGEWPYYHDVTTEHPVTLSTGDEEVATPEPSSLTLLFAPIILLAVRRRASRIGRPLK